MRVLGGSVLFADNLRCTLYTPFLSLTWQWKKNQRRQTVRQLESLGHLSFRSLLPVHGRAGGCCGRRHAYTRAVTCTHLTLALAGLGLMGGPVGDFQP